MKCNIFGEPVNLLWFILYGFFFLGLTFCLWNIRIKASDIIHWIWIPWKVMVMQLQGYASPLMDAIWRQVFKHICSQKIYVVMLLFTTLMISSTFMNKYCWSCGQTTQGSSQMETAAKNSILPKIYLCALFSRSNFICWHVFFMYHCCFLESFLDFYNLGFLVVLMSCFLFSFVWPIMHYLWILFLTTLQYIICANSLCWWSGESI